MLLYKLIKIFNNNFKYYLLYFISIVIMTRVVYFNIGVPEISQTRENVKCLWSFLKSAPRYCVGVLTLQCYRHVSNRLLRRKKMRFFFGNYFFIVFASISVSFVNSFFPHADRISKGNIVAKHSVSHSPPTPLVVLNSLTFRGSLLCYQNKKYSEFISIRESVMRFTCLFLQGRQREPGNILVFFNTLFPTFRQLIEVLRTQ